jgi:hypothetical protein
MLIDLHVEAPTSASGFPALAEAARTAGLDALVVASTDALPTDVPSELGGVRFFAAARLATDRGHYLVFLPTSRPPGDLETLFGPRVDGLFAIRTVLVRAQALQGAVVAAYPYDLSLPRPGGDILYTLASLNAVEVVSPGRLGGLSLASVEAAETVGLPTTGGSGASSPADVGRAATLFSDRIEQVETLIDALRAGRCWPVEFGSVPANLSRRSPSPPREPSSSSSSGEPRRRRRRR